MFQPIWAMDAIGSKVISTKDKQKAPQNPTGEDQSGEASTLVGRKIYAFGDRVEREKPDQLK